MALVTVGLSFATLAIDWTIRQKRIEEAGWLWAGGPDGARELLSTIAGSMITVTGVVFSITIVVLALASSQFGPRLLRTFLRDRGTQTVLGTFISTFTYCFLVLRTVRSDDAGEFVPHISVTIAIGLALASVGVLIYFIHHISVSIQAPIILARVADELDRGIERLFPECLGEAVQERKDDGERRQIPQGFDREARTLPAGTSGYLRAIDGDRLMEIAIENDLIVRLEYRPGHFVIQGSELALIWPKEKVNDQLIDKMKGLFIVGPERTETQDVEFAVHQIVEVALRALSPGVNEPFTAITCVDRLGAALCRLAGREIPSPYRYDPANKLRVIADGVDFPGVADAAFNQIRQSARSSAAVTIRLLETLVIVVRSVNREEDRTALLRQAVMIERGGREGLAEEQDRKDVEERYRAFLKALDEKAARPMHGSGGASVFHLHTDR